MSTDLELFATKGIEYLLVLAFLAALVLFWRLLNRAAPAAALAGRPVGSRAATLGSWFRIMPHAFYHQGHTWAAPEERGVVTVGMDDFSQRLLGRLSSLRLPALGARIKQGSEAWQVRVDRTSFDLLSPVDGEVVALNEAVLRSPELVNDDPYGKGWLFKVRVADMKSNLRNLLSGGMAEAWMDRTAAALRRRMGGELGLVMQDGGEPVTGIARALSDEQWEDVAKGFLLTA